MKHRYGGGSNFRWRKLTFESREGRHQHEHSGNIKRWIIWLNRQPRIPSKAIYWVIGNVIRKKGTCKFIGTASDFYFATKMDGCWIRWVWLVNFSDWKFDSGLEGLCLDLGLVAFLSKAFVFFKWNFRCIKNEIPPKNISIIFYWIMIALNK